MSYANAQQSYWPSGTIMLAYEGEFSGHGYDSHEEAARISKTYSVLRAIDVSEEKPRSPKEDIFPSKQKTTPQFRPRPVWPYAVAAVASVVLIALSLIMGWIGSIVPTTVIAIAMALHALDARYTNKILRPNIEK
jgi:type VI protein secretion system component VasF